MSVVQTDEIMRVKKARVTQEQKEDWQKELEK
jgi:hypothetical protein